MNNEETAWSYVRHDASDGDISHASHTSSFKDEPSWWRICDGQCVKVTEEEVLTDSNTVFFLVYNRRSMKDADATVNGDDGDIATIATSSQLSQLSSNDSNDKPNKTMRLDSEMDWWNKSVLAVSRKKSIVNVEIIVALQRHLYLLLYTRVENELIP